MKTKSLWVVALLSFLLSGCAARTYVIGYDIIDTARWRENLGRVYIQSFIDERPKAEREGVAGKLLSFSSRDAHFSKDVAQAITDVLAEELEVAGFSVVEKEQDPDYRIAGAVKHFQAVMSPAKITFLPYLGSVSTLWAKDNFTIALSLDIQMTRAAGHKMMEQTFDVSEDLRLPTRLLNLARYSRGFDYKLKLLNEALKDVMGQVRNAIIAKVKNEQR